MILIKDGTTGNRLLEVCLLYIFRVVIIVNELKCVYLIVITQSSVKPYLITSEYFGDTRPHASVLFRVKLLPDYATNTVMTRFFILHMVYSMKRLKLSLANQTEESDALLTVRNDYLTKFLQLTETYLSIMLDN